MIETSFVILPLMAMFLMIMDVTTVVFIKGILQHSVREGVRFAITYSTSLGAMSCSTQSSCITSVVQSNSIGFLSSPAAAATINVKYYAPFDLSTPLTGPVPAVTSGPNQHPAIDYINQTGNIIEVNVTNFHWNWMAPLASFAPGTGLDLSASASDVLQGLPVGTFVPPTP